MLLRKEEIVKHNKLSVEFIARMAMLVMINLRNKENVVSGYLPIPKTIDEITSQNQILYSVITNIIKNDLKLDENISEPLQVKETSYLQDVDMFIVAEKSVDNSEVSTVLGEKLMFNISFIKDTILETIKKFAMNVESAKAQYEINRVKSNFKMIPISVPDIIDYFIAKGEFTDVESLSITIPSYGSGMEQIINWDNTDEQSLRNKLLSYYEFNKDDVYNFLTLFPEGDVVKIARAYLSVLNNSNSNLLGLIPLSTNKFNIAYLLYLISKMLLDTDYSDRKSLSILNNTFKALSHSAYITTTELVNNKVLVTYIDNDKVYVLDKVYEENLELDNTAIIGAVINANVKDNVGAVLINVDTLMLKQDAYKDIYNQYEITKSLEVETGMKSALINIYAIEAKKIIEELPEDVTNELNLPPLALIGIVTNYISDLDFKSAVNIKYVCEQIVLNHIFKDDVANKFIEYYHMYSTMNDKLTSQDCALLAAAGIVVLELGSNFNL